MSGYSLGLRAVGLAFKIPVLSGFMTAASRIWLRHARWRCHLSAFQFDGVIDGGANIGEFASVVRATLPQAHLICVEPHPQCAATLRQHGFEVVEAALWKETTKLTLTQSGPSTASTVMGGDPSATAMRVDAVRLCDLPIRGNRLLIKLDLQGAEPFALEALGPLEARCVGFLLEVSLPPKDNYEALNQYFVARGFHPFASVNELFNGNRQVEADILWIKAGT